jgi:hypothetical protein|tara:strand:+ start:36 stop:509 length:474 start_codon:yes stop_codon:yes gene_type:complete
MGTKLRQADYVKISVIGLSVKDNLKRTKKIKFIQNYLKKENESIKNRAIELLKNRPLQTGESYTGDYYGLENISIIPKLVTILELKPCDYCRISEKTQLDIVTDLIQLDIKQDGEDTYFVLDDDKEHIVFIVDNNSIRFWNKNLEVKDKLKRHIKLN